MDVVTHGGFDSSTSSSSSSSTSSSCQCPPSTSSRVSLVTSSSPSSSTCHETLYNLNSLMIRTPRRPRHRGRVSRRLAAARGRRISAFRQLVFDPSSSDQEQRQQQDTTNNTPSTDLQNILQDIRQQSAERFRKTWGFDILTGLPLDNGPWKWTPI